MNKIDIKIPLPQNNYLEGCLLFQHEADRKQGVVICPPHPLLAGNMANNIVQAIANLAAQSMPVLLFNYQAVGNSYKPTDIPLFEHWQHLDQQNNFAQIISETKTVLSHSCRYFNKTHLVGYSFGAFIAHHCINENCKSFTAITPPLAEHNFSKINHELPIMTILAEKDELLQVASNNIFLANSISKEINNTDHFFIKREDEVAKEVVDFLLKLKARV